MQINTIDLLPGVRETIAGQLVSAYPNEGCGALVGSVGADGAVKMTEAVGIPNVEPVRSQDRFTLDPRGYAALEERLAASKDGSRIVGFFHSHPDGIAQPSKVDLEMAQGLYEFTRTHYLYAIQAITNDGAGELSFWKLSESRDSFIAV